MTDQERAQGMAEQRYGGALDALAEALSRGEDKGDGVMRTLQALDRPYGGETPALGGLLGMLGPHPPSFSTVKGSAAVDKMLSEGDPSQRFRVYRRSMASSKGDSKRSSSGSFSHWLFISEDGKRGFGFNQDGEEVEIPDSLEHYELHPGFKKSYTAAGLISARKARQKRNDEVSAVIRNNAYRMPVLQEAPDPYEYFLGINDCQNYVQDLDSFYKE